SGTNTSTVGWLCSGAPAPGMDLTTTVLKPLASAMGGCRAGSSAAPRPMTLKLDTPCGIIVLPKALGSVGFSSEKRATRLSISSREICLLAIRPPFADLAAGLRRLPGDVNLRESVCRAPPHPVPPPRGEREPDSHRSCVYSTGSMHADVSFLGEFTNGETT